MAKKRVKTEPPAPPSKGAILSPMVDFLCCGGLSIITVAGLFVYSLIAPESELFHPNIDLEKFTGILILGTLINFPHFMASYRLLYRTRTQIAQHSWVSTYVPLILLILIIYALRTPSQDPENPEFANRMVVELFTVFGMILLAWHYTGQAWGMTASFAYIAGIRMDSTERRLIRSGFYALLVWHVLWACMVLLIDNKVIIVRIFNDQAPFIQNLYHVWTVVVLLTIPLGILGFIRIRRRTGKSPPLRCLAPWIAIYFWYALIWAFPRMLVFLQIFHALQYLIFPIRVEVNQYSAKKKRTEIKRIIRGAAYYVVLVIVGLVVSSLPSYLSYKWGDHQGALGALVAGFVNIHHYTIDGVIWKLRNPAVRRDLFAHLKSP